MSCLKVASHIHHEPDKPITLYGDSKYLPMILRQFLKCYLPMALGTAEDAVLVIITGACLHVISTTECILSKVYSNAMFKTKCEHLRSFEQVNIT